MAGASYEVTYFDGPFRAEPIRVMLHAAGVKFKDTRFNFSDWEAIKSLTPLGVVPTLKIDGVTFCQSTALARYAAKLAGFYPEDALDALIVDEVMETCNEIMSSAPQDPDPEQKKKKRKEWQDGSLTRFCILIELRIQAAGGHSVVKTPSVADLAVWANVDGVQRGFYDHIEPNFFEQFPGITATALTIVKEPRVKAYYDFGTAV